MLSLALDCNYRCYNEPILIRGQNFLGRFKTWLNKAPISSRILAFEKVFREFLADLEHVLGYGFHSLSRTHKTRFKNSKQLGHPIVQGKDENGRFFIEYSFSSSALPVLTPNLTLF